MRKLYIIASLSLASVGGCTAINSNSFSDMSSAYRKVIEEYSNSNILLNIVRSSQNMPLSFADIPSVIGTGSVTAEAEASAAPVSWQNGMTSASSRFAVNNGFTFTQASLDNAEFMKSFLKEIPLNHLGFKGTERMLPKAVSYTLLIESIELRNSNKTVAHFGNDPQSPDYNEFQLALSLLIEAGLTVEYNKVNTPIGPALDKKELTKTLSSWGTSALDHIAKGNMKVQKITKDEKEEYQLVLTELKPHVCVNKFSTKELFGDLLHQSNFCKNSLRLKKQPKDIVYKADKFATKYNLQRNTELFIVIRSPGNVFDFLGSVLNSQLGGDESKTIMITPNTPQHAGYSESYMRPRPLFKVYKDIVIPDPAFSVRYKGSSYSVSDNDNSYSKEVIEFMSTLITVAKIPGALPPSPAVLVR